MINNFAALDLEIEIAAQKLFMIGNFVITNSMLTGLVGAAVTMGALFYVGVKVKNGKYNRFVGLIQWVFEGLLHQIEDIIPDRKLGRKITPLAVTIFFLILINLSLIHI